MKIPFLDLKNQYNLIKDEITLEIQNVIDKTAFASGPFVEKFEHEYARFCKAKYCIALNSGTSALHLALLAHGIESGDEVITVPNSFIATAWGITYCDAKPVFIDVEPNTFLMDPKLIESAITSKTKAILPVHLYGKPANMIEINKIAKKYNLIVIEDAAQAHAASYKGKMIGGLGNTTCFSFYPGKNLGAYGEGGAILTNNLKIAENIRLLRDHGQSKRYYHDCVGFNYRMDGLQGAVLSVKLKYLKEATAERNKIAKFYNDSIIHKDEIQLPVISSNSYSSFHLYVIHTKYRNKLMNYLNNNGIMTGLHYPVPIHLQKAYKNLNYKKGDFPISEKNANECLTLPLYAELSLKHRSYIVECINNYFN